MSAHILHVRVPARQSPRTAALPKICGSAISACLNTAAAWMIRGAQRRLLRELAEEGHLLSDVGLTRAQALREAAKPFWRR
jgi:uncharacterized protein YjiS (DUF1127 family)